MMAPTPGRVEVGARVPAPGRAAVGQEPTEDSGPGRCAVPAPERADVDRKPTESKPDARSRTDRHAGVGAREGRCDPNGRLSPLGMSVVQLSPSTSSTKGRCTEEDERRRTEAKTRPTQETMHVEQKSSVRAISACVEDPMAEGRRRHGDVEGDDGRFEGEDGRRRTKQGRQAWQGRVSGVMAPAAEDDDGRKSKRGRGLWAVGWTLLLTVLVGLLVGDETKRASPHETIVTQGLPPHPGPGYDPFAEFDDNVPEEGDIEQCEEDDGSSDGEDGRVRIDEGRKEEQMAKRLQEEEEKIGDAVDAAQAPVTQYAELMMDEELKECIALKRSEVIERRCAKVRREVAAELNKPKDEGVLEGVSQDVDFVECKKYKKPPVGFVFQTGEHGLGLYREHRRVTLELAKAVGLEKGTVPIKLRLCDVIDG